MLATHRRSWPGWAELERRGRERGAPVGEGVPPFPGGIAALVGLGYQGAGDLASAGVLAHLWPPDGLKPLPARWEMVRQIGPLKGPIPDPIYELQCNRSGTPLYSDGKSVLGFAEETQTF